MSRQRGKQIIRAAVLFLTGLFWLTGCGSPSSGPEAGTEQAKGTELAKGAETAAGSELVYERSMELQYAENFAVDYYEGGYTMLSTMDGSRFLIVPEGKEAPEQLEQEVIVLQRPIENIYLVASGVMDMFGALEGTDAIAFSGQKEENWYIREAKEAMHAGKMVYAGKYSKPDYELLAAGGCRLAIENRMVLHTPEVVEKLEDFDIPVLIECSAYEPHPLGRVEWVKFFGALLGREEEAENIFREQEDIVKEVTAEEKSGQTVAFFFVTSNGLIQVRKSSDYVPKMIEMAGGSYVFEAMEDVETGRSSVNMQVEEFYDQAKDADYLIYNSSIDGGITSLDELLEKCGILADFRAVKEGRVWCTTNDMYQQSLSTGYLTGDIHEMLSGGTQDSMKYLFRLR